jgi:hypothetical protein
MREDQLERSLRASAPRVPTTGVLDRVAQKRARRRSVRRLELGALATVVVVAVASAVVLLTHDDGGVTRIEAPAAALRARVVAGDATVVTRDTGSSRPALPIALDPDQGYVRGPLSVSGSTLSFAAYDHDGATFTFPPSRIVRVDDRTFREEGRTDLKAEILSMADGEGARWAVTRNPAPATGLPDAFLKRITAEGRVTSTLLPPGTDPVGNIAVGAGAVWIPLRDGVLRCDAATAQFTARYDLEPAETRAVAITNGVVATDRGDLVSLLADGTASGISAGTINGDRVIGLTTTSAGGLLRLTTNPGTGRVSVGDERLPRGFRATSLAAVDGRVWVEGLVDGAPAVTLIRENGGIEATIVLDDARDVSFAWVRPDTVLATTNGALVRIDLKNLQK